MAKNKKRLFNKKSKIKLYLTKITYVIKKNKVSKYIIYLGILFIFTVSIQLYLREKKVVSILPSGKKSKITSSTQVKRKVNIDLGHFPIRGNKVAKVTIIEFADFRCPYCKMSFSQIEPKLFKDYVNTGKAKFAFRQFVKLGPASEIAANAAECANDQGKFWEIHDYLFQYQPLEKDVSMYTVENLTVIAGRLGLDTYRFGSCLSKNRDNRRVTGDYKSGEEAGVYGTPTFFINGKMIVGAKPYSEFQTVINQSLNSN